MSTLNAHLKIQGLSGCGGVCVCVCVWVGVCGCVCGCVCLVKGKVYEKYSLTCHRTELYTVEKLKH